MASKKPAATAPIDIHAEPDGRYHWTPALEKAVPPSLGRGNWPAAEPWTFAPLPESVTSDRELKRFNERSLQLLGDAGIWRAQSLQEWPSDPAFWRDALGDLFTGGIESNNYIAIHDQGAPATAFKWLVHGLLQVLGLSATLDILQHVAERANFVEPNLDRVRKEYRVFSNGIEIAHQALMTSDEVTWQANAHHLGWIGEQPLTGWFGMHAITSLPRFCHAYARDLPSYKDELGQPAVLLAMRRFGADALPMFEEMIDKKISFTGTHIKQSELPAIKRLCQWLMPLHDGRLIDFMLAFATEGLMQQHIAELIERWPLYTLQRLLQALVTCDGDDDSDMVENRWGNLVPRSGPPVATVLKGLLTRALHAHPEWAAPLRERLVPELQAALDPLVKDLPPALFADANTPEVAAASEPDPVHAAPAAPMMLPDLHAQPDGQFHWTDADEQEYARMTARRRSNGASSDAKRLAMARSSVNAALVEVHTAMRFWSRSHPTFVRSYVSEARAALYLAMRLHHPRLLQVLLLVPGESMMQDAWQEAFERWPLLALRHALAWTPQHHAPATGGSRGHVPSNDDARATIDRMIARALAAHPDWVEPLRAALAQDAAADPETAVLLERFDRLPTVAATASATASTVVAIESHPALPPLLREPPWLRAKKPSAQEKAAQPWLKLPARLPELPLFVVPAELPAPQLSEGDKPIDTATLGHLLTMLMLGKPDAPWPGLGQVLPAFTHDSLARLGRELFRAWDAAGASPEHKWMLFAQGTLGDALTAEALRQHIADWPSAGQFHLAKYGLATLGRMGARPDEAGEAALRALIRFAEKGKPSLRGPAREQVQRAANSLGLSPDELADRLVPDLGLTTPEAFVFTLGDRRFTLHFDETLQAFVRDAQGTRLKDLPKPTAGENADGEVARWKALKKAAKALASEQIARLEHALITGRTWQRADFDRLFTRHPLLRELSRRLLWAAAPTDGGAPALFRLSEEFQAVDVADQPIALPGDARLALAHPIDLSDADRAAWGQVWADYELAPPFPQLAREVFRLSADPAQRAADLAAHGLAPGRPIAAGSLLGLMQQGWRREGDGAHVFGLSWQPALGVIVKLDLEDGFDMMGPLETPQQSLRALQLEGELSPRIASEVLRTVSLLARA